MISILGFKSMEGMESKGGMKPGTLKASSDSLANNFLNRPLV